MVINRLTRVVFAFFVLFLFTPVVSASNDFENSNNRNDAYTHAVLKGDLDNLVIFSNAQSQRIKFIRLSNLRILWDSDDNVQRSYQFFEIYSNLFDDDSQSIKDKLKLTKTTQDRLGMSHLTFQQTYEGIPVYSAKVTLHFKENSSLSSMSSSYISELGEVPVDPQITISTAKDTALQNLQNYLQINQEQFSRYQFRSTRPDLIIYQSPEVSGEIQQPRLTWQISIVAKNSVSDWTYFVDAISGEILYFESALLHAKNRETYTLADCHDTAGTLIYNEDGLLASYDADAAWTHLYAGYAYAYFFDNFLLDSYDGSGGTITSFTHFQNENAGSCYDIVDAIWRYSNSSMYFARGVYSQDIIAHEFTHGVLDNLVELERSGESLILHESYSDIFAVLVESYAGDLDWTIGEDLASNRSDDCTQGFRDLSNPSSLTGSCDGTGTSQPDHIDDLGGDYSDEHAASNIPSYAFYLLANGGTHHQSGVIVDGIGIENAEQIYIHILNNGYINADASLEDSYYAALNACLDLNASDSATYPISYCESVFDAFAAVGINTDISYAWANISASSTSGTAPLAITFDAADSMTINSTIVTYAWDFGDGSIDTTGAVSHTFTDPGTYVVTLTVTDSNGVTGTASTTITVYASGTISTDTTWLAERSPYVVAGSLSVSTTATLTIEPGVVVKFYSTDSSLSVGGTVEAQGTEANPIVFTSYYDDEYGGDTNNDGTSTTPAAGDWYYMYFASVSTATLDYVTIRYGGTTDYSTDYPMLMLYSSSNTLSNSMISDSEYHAVGLSGNPILTSNTISTTPNSYYGITMSSDSPTITNNTFTDNKCAVYVSGTATPILTNNIFTGNQYAIYLGALNSGIILTGNDGSDNSINGIIVNASTSGDIEFNTDNELPYVLSAATVSSGDTLTIVPGTVIKFYAASYGTYSAWSAYLSVFGTLIAEGTTTDPIIFTSISDDDYGGDTDNNGTASSPVAGDWEALSFVSTSTANISHAYIQYGGGRASGSSINSPMVYINSDNVTLSESNLTNSDYYSVSIYNASPTITNSTIQSSDSRGVNISGGSIILTGNVITDHPYGVYTSSGASPTLFNNLIYDNTYGLYNADSTVTVNAEHNWWGDTSGPYNASTNPSGLGDTAGSYIDFDPWLTSEDYTPPSDVTLGTIRKDAWAQTVTLTWTNPADTDFDHVQIDRIDVAASTTTTLSSAESGTSYSDTTPSYNRIYTYTLYACDTSSNCSTGVTTASQRLRNPAPTHLILTPGDTTITASWAASSAPTTTLGGYKIYYGTSAGALTTSLDVGNVTSTTLTSLTNGTRYYVAVTAYSRTGVESPRSTVRAARPRP